ncbi:MAG TPA: NAD-dependent epimerase/dehydratase family protein [Gemmatimonadaceae bacterium]|nr:NAD-dependent epimerase/dehydratase family protein [Gemmatimonadaceae bacterium]
MIVVTGATGLLGNNVVRRFLARGERVRVLVRDPASPALRGLAVETVVGDVTRRSDVDRALAGASLVVHAAAVVRIGRRDLDELRRVNVGGTENVARACLRGGVRLVHVSSVDALGWGTLEAPGHEESAPTPDHGIAYVRSKREAFALVCDLVAQGLDARIVHPAFMLGPNDWRPSSGRLVVEAVRLPWLPAPPGGNDFCHVDDVVSGVIAAAERGTRGRDYVLGGAHHSYASAYTAFRRAAGRQSRAWSLPRPALMAAGWLGDLAGAVTGSEPAVNSGAIAASCHEHHFDDARARRELGYRARPLTDAARDAVNWFVERGVLSRRGLHHTR